jgi:hypothetical protein
MGRELICFPKWKFNPSENNFQVNSFCGISGSGIVLCCCILFLSVSILMGGIYPQAAVTGGETEVNASD